MLDIASFIKQTQQEGCETRLLRSLVSLGESLGYDHMIYSLLTDHRSIGMEAQHGVLSTYPESWLEHYQKERYLTLDPVVNIARSVRWPFQWSEEISKLTLRPIEKRVMEEAKDAGLKDGICMTVELLPGEIAGLALASSKHQTPVASHLMPILFLAFQQTHRRYCEIKGAQFRAIALTRLSVREQEILRWLAEGKSSLDIGAILGISKSTVQTYVNRMVKKLGTGNTIGAVLVASRLGLINPQSYQLFRQSACRAIDDRRF